jgi:hypothetical protein
MDQQTIYNKLDHHIRLFFEGHQITESTFDEGPLLKIQPNFRVLCIQPGPKLGLWAYISKGTWELGGEKSERMEFMILSPKSSRRCIQLLAMSAYYHHTDGLGLEHTFPVGEPWLENSTCDHFLISLPYTLSPKLEICQIGDEDIHVYWALPITKREREYKLKNGLEALEAKFEEKGLMYWKLDRPSVI